MIENGMVMPTDVNFDRKRQRKVVFYGEGKYGRRVNIGETIKQQVRKYIAIKALKYNVLTKRDCN